MTAACRSFWFARAKPYPSPHSGISAGAHAHQAARDQDSRGGSHGSVAKAERRAREERTPVRQVRVSREGAKRQATRILDAERNEVTRRARLTRKAFLDRPF